MKKKFFLLLFSVILIHTYSYSQQSVNPKDLLRLQAYEDSLRVLGDSLVRGEQEYIRKQAGYEFIRKLVKALQIKGSYDYPFQSLVHEDSLQIISIIQPEDKSFRIFNWALAKDNGSYRYFGAIQMKSKKSLKLKENFFPLFDYSDFLKKDIIMDTVLNDSCWWGAVYYNIVSKKVQGRNYYFLFGWHGQNLLSTKKIVEVLYFDKGNPQFGSPMFEVIADTLINAKKLQNRFILEYKRTAGVALNYDLNFQKIIFDHLVSEVKAPELKYTYIPDGTYEGFEFKNGKWQSIDNIPYIKLKDGQSPRPLPKGSDKFIK